MSEMEDEGFDQETPAIEIVSRIKKLEDTEEFQTGGTGFKVKSSLTKKEAAEMGYPAVSFSLTLENRNDYDQLFKGIGSNGLFKITIAPM